jgi:hypothetical protein
MNAVVQRKNDAGSRYSASIGDGLRERRWCQTVNGGSKMKQEINSGRVFVENGTRIPIFLATESRPYLSGWVSMEGVAWRQFRKDLNAAGWTYFNIGIELKVTVFGFDRQRMLSRAVQRLSELATSRACNCLELNRMTTMRWVQLPSLTVYAHARRLQQKTSVWPEDGWTTLLQRCLQNSSRPILSVLAKQV